MLTQSITQSSDCPRTRRARPSVRPDRHFIRSVDEALYASRRSLLGRITAYAPDQSVKCLTQNARGRCPMLDMYGGICAFSTAHIC